MMGVFPEPGISTRAFLKQTDDNKSKHRASNPLLLGLASEIIDSPSNNGQEMKRELRKLQIGHYAVPKFASTSVRLVPAIFFDLQCNFNPTLAVNLMRIFDTGISKSSVQGKRKRKKVDRLLPPPGYYNVKPLTSKRRKKTDSSGSISGKSNKRKLGRSPKPSTKQQRGSENTKNKDAKNKKRGDSKTSLKKRDLWTCPYKCGHSFPFRSMSKINDHLQNCLKGPSSALEGALPSLPSSPSSIAYEDAERSENVEKREIVEKDFCDKKKKEDVVEAFKRKNYPYTEPQQGLRILVAFDEGIFAGIIFGVSEKIKEGANGGEVNVSEEKQNPKSYDLWVLYDDGFDEVVSYPDENGEVAVLPPEGLNLRPSISKYRIKQKVYAYFPPDPKIGTKKVPPPGSKGTHLFWEKAEVLSVEDDSTVPGGYRCVVRLIKRLDQQKFINPNWMRPMSLKSSEQNEQERKKNDDKMREKLLKLRNQLKSGKISAYSVFVEDFKQRTKTDPTPTSDIEPTPLEAEFMALSQGQKSIFRGLCQKKKMELKAAKEAEKVAQKAEKEARRKANREARRIAKKAASLARGKARKEGATVKNGAGDNSRMAIWNSPFQPMLMHSNYYTYYNGANLPLAGLRGNIATATTPTTNIKVKIKHFSSPAFSTAAFPVKASSYEKRPSVSKTTPNLGIKSPSFPPPLPVANENMQIVTRRIEPSPQQLQGGRPQHDIAPPIRSTTTSQLSPDVRTGHSEPKPTTISATAAFPSPSKKHHHQHPSSPLTPYSSPTGGYSSSPSVATSASMKKRKRKPKEINFTRECSSELASAATTPRSSPAAGCGAKRHLLEVHSLSEYKKGEEEKERNVNGGWKTEHEVWHHYGDTYVAESKVSEGGLGLFAGKVFNPPTYGMVDGKVNPLLIEHDTEARIISDSTQGSRKGKKDANKEEGEKEEEENRKKKKNEAKTEKGLLQPVKGGDIIGRYCVADQMMDWWEFKAFYPDATVDWVEATGGVKSIYNFHGPYSDRVMMLNLDCCDWFAIPFGKTLNIFERDDIVKKLGDNVVGFDSKKESMGLEGIKFAVCYENREKAHQPFQHIGAYANDFAFHITDPLRYWEYSKSKNNAIPIPVLGADPKLSTDSLISGRILTFIGSVLMAARKIEPEEEIGMCYGPGASTSKEFTAKSTEPLPPVPEDVRGKNGKPAQNMKEALEHIYKSVSNYGYMSGKYEENTHPATYFGHTAGPYKSWVGGIRKKTKKKTRRLYQAFVRGYLMDDKEVGIDLGSFKVRLHAEEVVKEFTHHPKIRTLLRKECSITKSQQAELKATLGLHEAKKKKKKKKEKNGGGGINTIACSVCGYPDITTEKSCPACYEKVVVPVTTTSTSTTTTAAATTRPGEGKSSKNSSSSSNHAKDGDRASEKGEGDAKEGEGKGKKNSGHIKRGWARGQRVLAEVPSRFPNRLEWRPAIVQELLLELDSPPSSKSTPLLPPPSPQTSSPLKRNYSSGIEYLVEYHGESRLQRFKVQRSQLWPDPVDTCMEASQKKMKRLRIYQQELQRLNAPKLQKGSVVELLGEKATLYFVIEQLYDEVWRPCHLSRRRMVARKRLLGVHVKRHGSQKGWVLSSPPKSKKSLLSSYGRGAASSSSASSSSSAQAHVKAAMPEAGERKKKISGVSRLLAGKKVQKKIKNTGLSKGGSFMEVLPEGYVFDSRNQYTSVRQRKRLVGIELMLKFQHGWARGHVLKSKNENRERNSPFLITFDDEQTQESPLDHKMYSGVLDWKNDARIGSWCVIRDPLEIIRPKKIEKNIGDTDGNL
eukprot:jgi/Bigna1/88791/estExt_fgenesh1_pg.C_380066